MMNDHCTGYSLIRLKGGPSPGKSYGGALAGGGDLPRSFVSNVEHRTTQFEFTIENTHFAPCTGHTQYAGHVDNAQNVCTDVVIFAITN